MKKIGIIGGLAWPSTADYYRLLCTKTSDHFRRAGSSVPYPTPHMVIESLNIAEMRSLRGHEDDDCLACTELPLAFPEHQDAARFEVEGITFVNTTVAHVEAAVSAALA